uniref:G_PROTEIN_RECEP_F1_2 domain-containing protein n=1 Tax=Heterorhabditis bacteriophora TaxID=37862 RepID=A0A1I7WLF0_HETBA
MYICFNQGFALDTTNILHLTCLNTIQMKDQKIASIVSLIHAPACVMARIHAIANLNKLIEIRLHYVDGTCRRLSKEMVFRAIDSIRDSVLNVSANIDVSSSSSLQNQSIMPTVELVLGTITYLVRCCSVQYTIIYVIVCQFVSLSFIFVFSRYCAIHDPINYAQKRTPRFVCVIIITVWFLSVMISVPPLIGWNDWSSQKLRDHCELSTERAFVVFSAAGSFFLPLLVMVVVYVKIFISARQRIRTNRGRSALMRIQNAPIEGTEDRRNSKKSSVDSSRTTSRVGEKTPLVYTERNTTVTSIPHSTAEVSMVPKMDETTAGMKYHNNGSYKSEKEEENPTAVLRKREKISVAKEKRAAKTIAVIIFVFSFCWLPFFCAYVILPFCESCNLHPKVNQAFTWLGYINSSLNPFLYGILNLEFRRAFKKILCPKTVLEQRRRRLSTQP